MMTVVPASLFDSPPEASIRALANVTDDRLIHDLRSAVIAVGYWYDAWWAAAHKTATPLQHRRAATIGTMRQNVALLGRDASLAKLADATRPLLCEFYETEQLRAAAGLVRDVVMHRWPMITYARKFVSAWDRDRERARRAPSP
jgi:hypothetical protein